MPDSTQRLTPRSAVASADFELLRVARHDLDEPETVASMSIAERIRGLALFRAQRPPDGEATGPTD